MSREALEYESRAIQSPASDTRSFSAGLKFIGYGLLFVGGAILTGAGTIAEMIRDGPGALVALAGAGICIFVLVALFMGAAARK